MIIPPQSLSPETLQGVLEEFINREGTDYGDQELSLQQKVALLRPQVESGKVVILFDPELQSLTLVAKEQL